MSTQADAAVVKAGKPKSVFVAFLLNLLWPGLGYAYIGIGGGLGVAFLVLVLLYIAWGNDAPGSPYAALICLAIWIVAPFHGAILASARNKRFSKPAERPLPVQSKVSSSVIDNLDKLAKLHLAGQLTDEEFADLKRTVLTSSETSPVGGVLNDQGTHDEGDEDDNE